MEEKILFHRPSQFFIVYLKTRYGTKRCSTFPIKNLVCHLQLPASRDRCLYLSNLPGNSNTQKLEAIFEMEADCNLEEVCLMKVGCTELSALVNVTFPEREFFCFRIHFDTLWYEIWMVFFTFQDPVSRSVNGVGWALMSDEESLQKAIDFYNSGEVLYII